MINLVAIPRKKFVLKLMKRENEDGKKQWYAGKRYGCKKIVNSWSRKEEGRQTRIQARFFIFQGFCLQI